MGSCECTNETSDFIKGGKFFHQLNNYLLKEDSAILN